MIPSRRLLPVLLATCIISLTAEAQEDPPSPTAALTSFYAPAPSSAATKEFAALHETDRTRRAAARAQEEEPDAATRTDIYPHFPVKAATFKEYTTWADENDSSVLYLMGQAETYSDHRNLTTARGLYRLEKAARQGYQPAMYRLAHIYRSGTLVPKDLPLAAYWFGRAAEAGGSLASTVLADAYREGQGVPQDYAQAYALYKRAAALGSSSGHLGLGRLYRDGLGVEVDLDKAMFYFENSAEHANSGAGNNASHIYMHGLGGTKKDLHKALKYMEYSAILGDVWACTSIANFLWDGQWTEEVPLVMNRPQACQFYSIAAEQGHAPAYIGLARCAATSFEGSPVDLDHARYLFREGIRHGFKFESDNLSEWARTVGASLFRASVAP